MKYFMYTDNKDSIKLSNNNLTVCSVRNSWNGARSNIPINTNNIDKIYIECTVKSFNNNNSGICLVSDATQYSIYLGGYYYWSDGTGTSGNKPWKIGDIIGIMYDKTSNNGTLSFSVNGELQPSKYTNLNNNKLLYLAVVLYNGRELQEIDVNFGRKQFKHKPNGYNYLESNARYLIQFDNQYYSIDNKYLNNYTCLYNHINQDSNLDDMISKYSFNDIKNLLGFNKFHDANISVLNQFNNKFKLLMYIEEIGVDK